MIAVAARYARLPVIGGLAWGFPHATAQEHRRSHHTLSNLVSFSRARKLEERGQRWLIQPHLDILARSPGKLAARMMECCIRTCCGPGIDPEMTTLFLSLSRRVCVLLTPRLSRRAGIGWERELEFNRIARKAVTLANPLYYLAAAVGGVAMAYPA